MPKPEWQKTKKDISICYKQLYQNTTVRTFVVNFIVEGISFPIEIVAAPNPRETHTASDPRYLEDTVHPMQLLKAIKTPPSTIVTVVSLDTNYGALDEYTVSSEIPHLNYHTPDYEAPNEEALDYITCTALKMALEAKETGNLARMFIHCGASKGRTSTVLSTLFVFSQQLSDLNSEMNQIKHSRSSTRTISDRYNYVKGPFDSKKNPNCLKITYENIYLDYDPDNSEMPMVETLAQIQAIDSYAQRHRRILQEKGIEYYISSNQSILKPDKKRIK